MEVVTPGKLLLSVVLLAFSTLAGWVLTLKLAGDEAGNQALVVCLVIAGLTLVAELAAYFAIRDRLMFVSVFYAVFGLNVVWFMLSLFIPIYWLDSVPEAAKWLASAILAFLGAANLMRGYRQFKEKWDGFQDPIGVGKVNRTSQTIDWERIQKHLRIDADIFIPGLPRNVTSLLSVLLIISMLVGLNFRSVYPVFSLYAWAIPCAVFGSFFFQLVGNRVAEARAIGNLQSSIGIVFRAVN
jgi:hypothetical protein